MNMQISPTSTHSHQLRDPLVDLIGYKVVCDTRDFKPCLCFTAVLRRKYSAMVPTHEFTHGLSQSILKMPHRHKQH